MEDALDSGIGDRAARTAQWLVDRRAERTRFLPREIFGEHSWDMLLALFLADARGQKLTGIDVATHCGTPAPVASRWLHHLAMLGLVATGGSQRLLEPVALTAAGLEAMERALAAFTISPLT